jgi:hypothetical protein
MTFSTTLLSQSSPSSPSLVSVSFSRMAAREEEEELEEEEEKDEDDDDNWRVLGEGNAHRIYAKKKKTTEILDEWKTVEEEEEEDAFVLRRRRRENAKRKRDDDEEEDTGCGVCRRDFDRFVWSNGRDRRRRRADGDEDDDDDDAILLERDVRFQLGELETPPPSSSSSTIKTKTKTTTGISGNLLFSDAQRKRVRWNTELVHIESGFFERIDRREKEARDDNKEEEEEAAAAAGKVLAIRERNYNWIPFYATTSKRKRSSTVARALSIEIKPKCGFTFREDGKLRYDVKTNAGGGGKKSKYDPRKFFEHCEIWSFADGVDYEELKKQLVRELEHMIETPRNTFRVREAKTGRVLWDATKGGSDAKRRFANVVSEAFAGKISLKEFLELIVSALQQDGTLKRLIRAQKYGRLANAYDYYGPDEEEMAMRRLAPKSILRAHAAVLESYENDDDNIDTTKRKQLKDAFEICQDAVISAIAKDASIILAVRLIPGGIHRRVPDPPPRRSGRQKYDAYDRAIDVARGEGERKDSAPRFAVSVNICDVGLKPAMKIPRWAELDS